ATASVALNAPTEAQIVALSNVTFSFVPTAETAFDNCSLWTNSTGSWSSDLNQTAIQNATTNSMWKNVSDGYYLAQIGCSANLTAFSSANKTFRVDTTAPSSILNLNASGSSTSVNVSWNASTDATALFYAVSRNGIAVANVTVTSFSENVTAGQAYNYSVKAQDAANWTSATASVIYTAPTPTPTPSPTPTPAPTPNPLTISGITVTSTSSGTTFSWSIPNGTANASVSYSNSSGILGIVTNPTFASSHSLSVAGLSPMKTYSASVTSCNATACGYNMSLSFTTMATSYPNPVLTSLNTTTAGAWANFISSWTDSQSLSHYIFSHNATGTMVNQTPVPFGTSTGASVHLLLNANTHTLNWLFWANNSQGAFNVTPMRQHYIAPVFATPVPAATPFPIPIVAVATPAPTPVPTPAPVATPVPPTAAKKESLAIATASANATEGSNLASEKNMTEFLNGSIDEFILLTPENAEVALSPTGLVVGVDTPEAVLRFSTNFTNTGPAAALAFRVTVNATPEEIQSTSDVRNASSNHSLILQTPALKLSAGQYQAIGEVFEPRSGKVLDTKALVVNVASSTEREENAIIGGVVVALLGIGSLIVFQLRTALKA
ncbi:MAG TPA: hypothetical protein VI874_00260, partial [Candidatus Norongarragalinales archaeon]|nr:hypothetical protein [Candidatus Norongarragalinales archaeon]